MGLFTKIAILAVRPLAEGASRGLGGEMAATAVQAVTSFLADRFTDHSQLLTQALGRAYDHSWRAVEVALAGDSWWDRIKTTLARHEDQAFRAQVRTFLDATPLAGLSSHGPEFRERCLAELRAARQQGWLAEEKLAPRLLAEKAGLFVNFADPQSVLKAEWQTLQEAAQCLVEAGFPTLAHLLQLPTPQGLSLLVTAVRYFFRREIETDRALFQGLAFAQLEQLGQAQENGFAALHQLLTSQSGRLENLLAEVGEVVRETQRDVKEMQTAMARHGSQLQSLGQVLVRALANQGQTAPATPVRQEQNIRLGMLNTLLTTPHRRLDLIWPMHQDLVQKDPRFYVQLAAWYAAKGEVRDHQEMFIVTLALSSFEGHRDVGLALLRQLPPYQVVRVIDFIHGRKETRRRLQTLSPDEYLRRQAKENPALSAQKRQGRKHKQTRKAASLRIPREQRRLATREVIGDFGLFRNVPRSLCTEVERYLAEREADSAWFDGTVLVARKALKRLYTVLHIKPGPRAQAILFDDQPPPDSRLYHLKRLAKVETPEEQAALLAEAKLPFRVAVSVLRQLTPAVLEVLIERMSPQEVINNLGMLQRHGAMTNPDLKTLIDLKLEEAKTHTKVSTFKAEKAAEAVAVSADIRRKLEEVADSQVQARGKLRRPTALLIDKSGSMEEAIDVGKKIAAMISAACENDLFVYAFDTIAYPVQPQNREWAAWKKAFAGISANGQTSCGIPLEVMRRKKQRVEQIILVTDEEEYDPPFFVDSLQKYRQEMGVEPTICLVRVTDSTTRLQDQCKRAGIVVQTFDFQGDYYSLPNLLPLLEPPSEMDLVMEIMDYPLPERRPG